MGMDEIGQDFEERFMNLDAFKDWIRGTSISYAFKVVKGKRVEIVIRLNILTPRHPIMLLLVDHQEVERAVVNPGVSQWDQPIAEIFRKFKMMREV